MPIPSPDHKKKIKKSRKNLFLPLLTITIAITVLMGIWYWKENTLQEIKPTDVVVETDAPSSILPDVHKPTDEASHETEVAKTAQLKILPPQQKDVQPTTNDIALNKSGDCKETADQLHRFFLKIDDQEYIKSFNLQTSLETHFITLIGQLLDNAPVVSRETDDLYTLLTNTAHFFRIIGKNNIILIKTILGKERDQVEDITQNFHHLISIKSCAEEQFKLKTSIEKTYEYAAFFLSTMGGRSYLFRRESRSRLLVNYYAILIVEQANDLELNYHGINLKEYLPFLIQEIENSNQLVYKELYLDNLYTLLEKYQ